MAIDDTAVATITDRGISVMGTFFFDEQGRPVNFKALRYNTDTRRLETWETPITEYGVFDGLNLPAKGKGVWKLPSGDFTYIELEITRVAYDRAARE
jgi:hypothetical protein